MNDSLSEKKAMVRGFLEQAVKSRSPGLQYVVVDPHSTLISEAVGFASIDPARTLTETTTMMAYSMSKTITAAAIVQLVERKQLRLDDSITSFVSDVPYGREVTIRHLLSQTSGIPDPIPLKWVHLVDEHHRFDEKQALHAVMNHHPKLEFPPGNRYAYSNISYWLLGQAIATVSGMTYEDYVRQQIFRPLDIPASEIDFVIPSRPNHAKGYLPKWSFMNLVKSFLLDAKYLGNVEQSWAHIHDHYLNGPAFGGIVASARAISFFLRDQIAETCRLLSNSTRQLFFEQQTTTQGKPIAMTLGWHIGQHRGIRFYFKEGGGGGFHTEMRVYPDQKIASVVMANNISFDVKHLLNASDPVFFPR